MTNSNLLPALVIGNGPSVDQLDPKLFDHFVTYGCNHIYTKFSDWGRKTDHVLITDWRRLNEIKTAYRDFPGGLWIGDEHASDPPDRLVRELLGRDFHPLRQLMKARLTRYAALRGVRWPEKVCQHIFDKTQFTFDLEQGFNFCFSVVFSAIQLAVVHGHTTICLTGVDASYSKPKDYFGNVSDKISYVNDVFVSNPRRWMEPLLVLLQIHLEPRNVTLLDCTPGGKLRFVPKGRLLDATPWFEPVPHFLS